MPRENRVRGSAGRESQRLSLLAEAEKRPGVHDVMVVYEGWQRADRRLDAYRLVTGESVVTPATDRANAQ